MKSVTGHQKKYPSLLDIGVILPHDNDQPHTAQQTSNLWQKFGSETLDSSTFSWDLAPTVKEHLSRHCFTCDKGVSHTAITWAMLPERMFYALGTDKLITGCEKSLNYQGDYVGSSVPVTLSLRIACFIYENLAFDL
jgi:hypothetical protein